MLSKLTDFLRQVRAHLRANAVELQTLNDQIAQQSLAALHEAALCRDQGDLCQYGWSAYSQGDEDGILREILVRLNLTQGTFLEIGIGDGLENNSAFLLAQGWRGAWVDANPGSMAAIRKGLAPLISDGRLKLFEMWIGVDNAAQLRDQFYGAAPLDVFSLDIDGPDLHVAGVLFADPAFRPKVVVVEYNAVWPPPVHFVLPYEQAKGWDKTDNFGVSFSGWTAFFSARGYDLVASSIAGTNLFFVEHSLSKKVRDPLPALEAVYKPARYHLVRAFRSGHPRSYNALLTAALAAASIRP